MEKNQYTRRIAELLYGSGRIGRRERDTFWSRFTSEKISADGSLRNFLRIKDHDLSLCIAVYPPATMANGLQEARSAFFIGSHLFSKGIPVPEIFGIDDSLGLIIFEDCGDTRLHDLLTNSPLDGLSLQQETRSLYVRIVEALALMQTRGRENFQSGWCYDTPAYDRDLMITRESQYFLQSFWYDLLGGEQPAGIEEEFEDIAAHAGKGLHSLFLHRDFQSRNIMVRGGDIRIIDFQGGRLGPPGYDLASLLIDPYIGLGEELRDQLMTAYLSALQVHLPFDAKVFRHQYSFLVVQRNLQILGAFSFLLQNRRKYFFREYIMPSLKMLIDHLSRPEMSPYVKLRGIAGRAEKQISATL